MKQILLDTIRSPEERDIWVKFARATIQGRGGVYSAFAAATADELLIELRARNLDDPIHQIKKSTPTGPGYATPTGVREP